MKMRWILLLTVLLVSAVGFPIIYVHNENSKVANENFFFGVSFGGKTASQAKLLIDEVKDYTNFFLVNNWDITTNETALNEVVQYAVDANLNTMVFFDFIGLDDGGYPWHGEWLLTAKDRWGDRFLGVYLYDEPGGKQIDTQQWRSGDTAKELFVNVSDYSDAANRFTTAIPATHMQVAKNYNLPVFTSDYALYWFDYLAGYDTVFVEIGWNHVTSKHIGLCRGAATVQQKDWGAIIVWNSLDPEDEEKGDYKTGPEMLEDMKTVYQAGAKYVIIFNYPTDPPGNPYGILTDEHFTAMESFWEMTRSPHQWDIEKVEAEAAFVLPKDYGWGMRTEDDVIWGVWEPDNKAPLIWDNMNKLIEKYGLKLDIIYDDPQFDYVAKYPQVICWNSTIIENLFEN